MAEETPQKRERLVKADAPLGHFDLPTMRAGRVKIKIEALEYEGDDETECPQANQPGGAAPIAES